MAVDAPELEPMEWFERGLCTFDNQDPYHPGGIFKPYPVHKAHLQWYISKLVKYRQNNIWCYKSRDLVTTKTNLGWLCYNLVWLPAMEMAIHRKAQPDVAMLIQEAYEMMANVPEPMLSELPKTLKKAATTIEAHFVANDDVNAGAIRGVSANPAALRGWNPNIYFWDEFEEDTNPDSVLHATVGSGRKMLQVIGVSNPKFRKTVMYEYVFGDGQDQLQTPRYNDDTGGLVWPVEKTDRDGFWMTEEIPGCWIGFNQRNDVVIMMHFTADPDKRADSGMRWRDEVTGEELNWFERHFLGSARSIRARQYNLSFESPTAATAFVPFKSEFHTKAHISIAKNVTIHVGMDVGEHNPAAVVFHYDEHSRLRVTDELFPPFGSFEEFMFALVRLLSNRYQGMQVQLHPDPTGEYTAGRDYFASMRERFGFKEILPPSDLTQANFRMHFINNLLQTVVRGEPMFLVDSATCPQLVNAFTHGYRMMTDRHGNVLDKPMKDGYFEHGVDALAYGVIATSYLLPDSVINVAQHPDSYNPYVRQKQKELAELTGRAAEGVIRYANI